MSSSPATRAASAPAASNRWTAGCRRGAESMPPLAPSPALLPVWLKRASVET
jgi:hypothetical protein